MAETKLRCPQCRSRDFIATETNEAVTDFDVTGGIVNREDGIHEFGAYVRLEARCKICSHRWKVRGASQIDHILTA